MRGEFLDVGGARLYYYAAGSRGAGEPIVLLHGFPTSGHLWNRVVPLLPEGHRVVVLDLLGYGRSDPPGSASLDIRAHADRVVAVLDHLQIQFACLAGHDMGGGVAQSVAVRHPHRVSGLCLASTAAPFGWPTRTARLTRAALPILKRLPANWWTGVLRSELLRGYLDGEHALHEVDIFLRPFTGDDGRAVLARHLASFSADELRAMSAELGSLSVPTAILWGEHDPFMPAAIGSRLHDLIPGSSLEVIPGARHFLPIECANAVAAGIRLVLGARG